MTLAQAPVPHFHLAHRPYAGFARVLLVLELVLLAVAILLLLRGDAAAP